MKLIPRMVLGALISAVCATSALAQTSSRAADPNAPKTRAQVKADLVDWRAAGYDPLNWVDYPTNAIDAGRLVAQRRAQSQGSQQ
jgi:Domain of unknown function (DUF4148)